MKKAITVALLFFSFCTWAQQNSFGVIAGLTQSWQEREQVQPTSTARERAKSITGLKAGVWWQMHHHKNFSTLIELNYLTLGSETKLVMESMILQGNPQGAYYKEKSGYLDIPILARLGSKRFFAGAGPSIGFWLFTRMKDTDGAKYIGPKYTTLHFSINGMAGVQVLKELALQVRYQLGINNVYDRPAIIQSWNRSIQAALTYQLLKD